MNVKLPAATIASGSLLAAGSGYLASTGIALDRLVVARTVTVDITGATGPQGPAGPAGEQGPTGEPGAQGPEGTPAHLAHQASSPASPGTAPASSN